MNQETAVKREKHKDRLLAFILIPVWGVLTVLAILEITIPLANALIVCLVYGPHAYFYGGIRVTDDKPARFTDGRIVPGALELLIGPASIAITFLSIGFFVAWVLERFKRAFKRRSDSAA